MLPSATEIVYALGLGEDLVGVTFECDEPPEARRDKTVVVGGKDTKSMTPGEIDAYVRGRLSVGEDLYTLHAGALAALDPELILTQDLCRVCALPSGHVEQALDHLGCRADVLSLDPHRLADVWQNIRQVGAATGTSGRAAQLLADIEGRLTAIAAAVAGRHRPTVAVVEWVDPPFPGGHWVPDLVTAAGGRSVCGRLGEPSVPLPWAQLREAVPDIVFVAPCGYHLDGAAEQARLVVPELPGSQVWAIDADGIVVRPGPRLVDGVEAIASVLHPDVLPPHPAVRRVHQG